MTSAYPIDLETLTERVRVMAAEQGGLPSKRGVMAAFKVGRPKATAALAALRADGLTPNAADDTDADGKPAERRLHVVPADEPIPTAPSPTPSPAEPAAVGGAVQVTDPVDAPATVPDTASDPVDRPDPALPAEPVADVAVPGGRGSWWWRWPLLLIGLGAFVAIWGGWVGLGAMTGFGPIVLLPGIADGWVINSAITLPLGMEAYAAFALRVWLAPPATPAARTTRARTFARRSALGALGLGLAGQIAFHLMTAAHITVAPWPITAFVAALPVAVLGFAAALAHLTTTHLTTTHLTTTHVTTAQTGTSE